MDGYDWLRAAALVAMCYGVYVQLKRRPKPFVHAGRRYYPLPDGRFCTRWGRIVQDPQLEAALRACHAAMASSNPHQD